MRMEGGVRGSPWPPGQLVRKLYVPGASAERLAAGRKVLVVLEAAGLELASTDPRRRRLELLQSQVHGPLLREAGREGADIRPDILHQCLLHLQGSPLNLAGKLAVFIRTSQNELIEVSPHLIVPKTWNQFESLMVTLLYRRSIRAVNAKVTLLKTVKNDLPRLLPAGCRKVALSAAGTPVADFRKYAVEKFAGLGENQSVVFYVGAVAKTNPTSAERLAKASPPLAVEECISISPHHLTAANVCGKICTVFEDLWDVI